MFLLNSVQASDFVIGVDDNSTIYYAKSNGDGTFSDYGKIGWLGGTYSRGVTINDFNNDGHMDFVTGRGISSIGWLYLFLNDGSDRFFKACLAGTLSNAGSYVEDMASGDFNNDGNMDFIANGDQSTTGIYLGDGKGNFTKTEMNLGAYGRGIDTADFNNDGNLDFVRGRYSSGYVDIYWGDGTGAFSEPTRVGDPGTDPYGVVAGDFDSDGFVDVIANYGSNGDCYFYKNNGDRTFAAGVYTASLDFNLHGSYDAFDYNGDGHLDVITVTYTGRQMLFFPGNGDATFGASVELGTFASNSLAVAAMPSPAPAGVPVAVTTPALASISKGGFVDFSSAGSFDTNPGGSISAYHWNFGDTGTDTAADPAPHTYTIEGLFPASLTVTDNDGNQATAVSPVLVQGDIPLVDTTPVIIDESHALDGVWSYFLSGSAHASDTENNIVSYEWDFGTLSDNFDDANVDNWAVYAGSWEVAETEQGSGNYSYRQTGNDDRTWTLMEDKIYEKDITIEVDVTLESGSGEEAQILFRASSAYNNYECIIRGRGNNDVLLYRRINNSTANLFEFNLDADVSAEWGEKFPIDAGHTYHVKIVCRGNLIQFYLEGHFLFAFSDDTFTRGKVGFSTYQTVASFDNLTVTESATGPELALNYYETGAHTLGLTVTDTSDQIGTGVIPITVASGFPPVADAGGAYAADETHAQSGGWTFALDGSGSTDDFGISRYVWNFGRDEFSGTDFEDLKWYTNDGITQDDAVSLTGTGAWDNRYMVSKAVFPRTNGQIFEARIKVPGSGEAMIGFKNSSTSSFHYNQFPYQFYLYNKNIYIYENSSSRGDTYFDYAYNIWYDFRIELTDTGAIYSYRESGTDGWMVVYTSDYLTADTELRKGMVVKSNTWSMDDFLETTAGETSYFTLYRGTGTFAVDLTVFDHAGHSHTDDTGSVTITDAEAPVSNAGPDQTKLEADAIEGTWTVNFDGTLSDDDNGLYLYEWDWDFDGTFDPSGDTGPTPSHAWDAAGTYTVALRVTDHALQTHIDTLDVTISLGDPPTAIAGGPYVEDEGTGSALEGGWTVALDGSGSDDGESSIMEYVWDLGTDTFDGTLINSGKWLFSDNVTQDGEIFVTGTNSWGNRYLCSKDIFARAKGLKIETRVNQVTGSNAMIGFKNDNTTDFSYTQMPYALYFNGGNLYVYEGGANRGDTGFNYSYNTWYDVKIELKETRGARYYYKEAGALNWILVYDSDDSTGTRFRKHLVVYSGNFHMDNYQETTAGVTPTVKVYGLGSRTISLTVKDQADQADTDYTSIETKGNNAPDADAGADLSLTEANGFDGTWTVDFDGSASSDDFGIMEYEWDFESDGVYDATGITVSHIYDAPGSYTVTLRVTDHALQSSTDTLFISITIGEAPVAEAGADLTTEGYWPVYFNGSGSTDDLEVEKYEWDFGDHVDFVNHDGPTSQGVGKTPRHIFWENGDYPVTLTVFDHAGQTDSDSLTVHVITADPPAADAGGPYNAGAGGPPAYFNGSKSKDDYGIVKYFWDADVTVDSDGDGTPDNDRDAFGRKPFYIYPASGSYTAKLTVEDGAGQTSSATATVNVADNLPPDVICVPWRSSDPTIPHETYNGRDIRLKAIVRDAGALTYQWNFGDGSAPYPATPAAVTNKFVIEAAHTYPDSADGTPYIATLTVWDAAGLAGTDPYYVIVKGENDDTRTNIAIDEGLWYTHRTQDRDGADYGKWTSYGSYYASASASAIHAFEINGHLQDGDNQENPYVETVNKGFDYLFTVVQSQNIGVQTYGDPDSNGNGIGVESTSGREIYEGGMIMDALASSNDPLAFARTGGTNIKDRFFFHLLTDMVDMYSYGQDDSGNDRGGWRYDWNSGADNSACQWAAIGMLAAEDNFGINVPGFIKTENNIWLDYSFNGSTFGYTTPTYFAHSWTATTPSGMVQLAFCDTYTSDARWKAAEDTIAVNWFNQSNNFYAIYALVKSFRLARPQPIVTLSATGLDWYNDPDEGVRVHLLDRQAVSGSYWGSWDSGGYGDRGLDTSWAIIMLTPSLFVQPPVADAGDDVVWAYDYELSFDASGSFHLDPERSLVLYEWDFNGDGIYDFTTSDPSDPNARYTYADPDPETQGDDPSTFIVRLRVTDDNQPPQTDIDTREVVVAEPPHAPFAHHGGPYSVTAGIAFTLDGSRSHDIDQSDSITLYEWDLDNDGTWFDDVDLTTTNARVSYTYADSGIYLIGLKVWDNGIFNPLGCVPKDETSPCTPMESKQVFTQVTVNANQPPTASAGGPYTVNEGAALTLDGTGSLDPNGDVLFFAWDLDNDGNYDDSTDPSPSFTWSDNGRYTVSLKVTDSLLESSTTVDVVVADRKPRAGFEWTPNPQTEGAGVAFTDLSTSAPDAIVSWAWDFGPAGTRTDQNPTVVFGTSGTYTVTLTVTDEDGSTDTTTHDVTIADKAPDAGFTWSPGSQTEGGTVAFTDTSSSSPDAVIGWLWDFGGLGTSTSRNPSFTFMDNGTFAVKLTVTDADGSGASVTHNVSITDKAPAAAVTGPAALDEGEPGTYDGSGSSSFPDAVAAYEWDFNYNGTGFIPSGDTGITASHAWDAPGIYTVALRVTDDDGSTDIAAMAVEVERKSMVCADLDLDQDVDGKDLSLFLSVMGLTRSDDAFNPMADFNRDGVIDGTDLGLFARVLGQHLDLPCSLPADLDADGDVDGHDLSYFIQQFGLYTASDPSWDTRADFNGDGRIDGWDIRYFTGTLGFGS